MHRLISYLDVKIRTEINTEINKDIGTEINTEIVSSLILSSLRSLLWPSCLRSSPCSDCLQSSHHLSSSCSYHLVSNPLLALIVLSPIPSFIWSSRLRSSPWPDCLVSNPLLALIVLSTSLIPIFSSPCSDYPPLLSFTLVTDIILYLLFLLLCAISGDAAATVAGANLRNRFVRGWITIANWYCILNNYGYRWCRQHYQYNIHWHTFSTSYWYCIIIPDII